MVDAQLGVAGSGAGLGLAAGADQAPTAGSLAGVGLAGGDGGLAGDGPGVPVAVLAASGRPDVSQQPDAAPAGKSPGGGGPSPSRRRLLTGAGLAGAGLMAGGVGGYFAHQPGTAATAGADSTVTVPFYGAHQAGIATPAQDRLAFGSLNVVDGASQSDLRDLLVEWTRATARMTTGQLVGEVNEPVAPPLDTGEAVGSPVSRLTVTIGYGP